MMPLLTERELASGLVALVRTVPELGKRTEIQSRAATAIGGYAMNVRILKNVSEAIWFVDKVFPFIDVLTTSTRCYVRIFRAIGRIIQG